MRTAPRHDVALSISEAADIAPPERGSMDADVDKPLPPPPSLPARSSARTHYASLVSSDGSSASAATSSAASSGEAGDDKRRGVKTRIFEATVVRVGQPAEPSPPPGLPRRLAGGTGLQAPDVRIATVRVQQHTVPAATPPTVAVNNNHNNAHQIPSNTTPRRLSSLPGGAAADAATAPLPSTQLGVAAARTASGPGSFARQPLAPQLGRSLTSVGTTSVPLVPTVPRVRPTLVRSDTTPIGGSAAAVSGLRRKTSLKQLARAINPRQLMQLPRRGSNRVANTAKPSPPASSAGAVITPPSLPPSSSGPGIAAPVAVKPHRPDLTDLKAPRSFASRASLINPGAFHGLLHLDLDVSLSDIRQRRAAAATGVVQTRGMGTSPSSSPPPPEARAAATAASTGLIGAAARSPPQLSLQMRDTLRRRPSVQRALTKQSPHYITLVRSNDPGSPRVLLRRSRSFADAAMRNAGLPASPAAAARLPEAATYVSFAQQNSPAAETAKEDGEPTAASATAISRTSILLADFYPSSAGLDEEEHRTRQLHGVLNSYRARRLENCCLRCRHLLRLHDPSRGC